jgi:histidine triad (HIT) family protein
MNKGNVACHEVYRDEHCFAILDIFPLKPGHLLLISNIHAERFEQLPQHVAAHLALMAQKLAKAQQQAGFGEQGYNLVINNGKVANQHIPHVHLHLIPRQKGDRWYFAWRYLTRFLDAVVMKRKQQGLAEIATKIKKQFTE